MRTLHRGFVVATISLASLGSGCGGSDGTASDVTSSVSVTLSGDRSGAFAFTGDATADPFELIGSARSVMGRYSLEADELLPAMELLVAMRPASAAGKFDVFLLWGPATTGATPLSNDDYIAVVIYGMPLGSDGDFDWNAMDAAYTIGDGTVNVQQISETRYRGTFSGTGYEWHTGAPITAVNGSFDLRGSGSDRVTESLCKVTGSC